MKPKFSLKVFLIAAFLTITFLELLCASINHFYLYPRIKWKEKFVISSLKKIAILDKNLFWRLDKNLADVNSHGFRGDEFPEDYKKRKIVLILGDSTVYGWGVSSDKTFSSLLQKKFDQKFSEQYLVINAGVPGYSSYQALKYFEEISDKFQPNVVITYVGANDCWNEGNFDRDSERFQNVEKFDWMHNGVLAYSNTFKMAQLIKVRYFSQWKKLRVLPDEFRSNLSAIKKLAGPQAQFLPVNSLTTNLIQYFDHPHEMLKNVKDIKYFDSFDQKIIENLKSYDYVRRDGMTLSELKDHKPESVFLDFFHFTELGHRLAANQIYEQINKR